MGLDERVSALIQRIYCAGDDCAEWDRIVEEILQQVGGCAGLTTLIDFSNRDLDCTRFFGTLDSKFARGIEEYAHYYDHDPSLIWAAAHPAARFCDSGQTVEGDYLAHPYIRWNRARFGSTHWYVGFTAPEDQLSYCMSVHFPAEQGPGDPQALQLFRLLFDHLECAVRLNRRPVSPADDSAVAVLDGDGRVRELSSAASRLLEAGDGLTIRDGRLEATGAADRDRLTSALARAAEACAAGNSGTAVKIARSSGKVPLLITIKPFLKSAGPFAPMRCQLLVRIHDGTHRIGSLDLVQSLFELTDRELEVVRLLANGHSLHTLSAALKISVNTARAHLRAIFAKTGTSRQAELLQLASEIGSS